MPEGVIVIGQSVEALLRFVEEYIAGEKGEDLRRQLADADADERHGFIVVGYELAEAAALEPGDTDLPARAPELPAPLDGLWIGTNYRGGRLIAWLPDRGWFEGALADRDRLTEGRSLSNK